MREAKRDFSADISWEVKISWFGGTHACRMRQRSSRGQWPSPPSSRSSLVPAPTGAGT